MPSVQLERLRPQINAIVLQYENCNLFTSSLIALLESYSGEIDHSPTKISPFSIIPRMNVPMVVLSQLEISLKHLAKIFPDQTKMIVKEIWDYGFFETKKIALFLLSNLPAHKSHSFFEEIEAWVKDDIELPILLEILENINNSITLSQDPEWMRLIGTWLSSKIERLNKIGLKALINHIQTNPIKDLPSVFQIIEPLLSDPHISINNELLELVKTLIEVSQAETAAFLIHLSVMYATKETLSFIRKCLSMFDPYFASEIKRKITKF
jgi:hypothetical protein